MQNMKFTVEDMNKLKQWGYELVNPELYNGPLSNIWIITLANELYFVLSNNDGADSVKQYNKLEDCMVNPPVLSVPKLRFMDYAKNMAECTNSIVIPDDAPKLVTKLTMNPTEPVNVNVITKDENMKNPTEHVNESVNESVNKSNEPVHDVDYVDLTKSLDIFPTSQGLEANKTITKLAPHPTISNNNKVIEWTIDYVKRLLKLSANKRFSHVVATPNGILIKERVLICDETPNIKAIIALECYGDTLSTEVDKNSIHDYFYIRAYDDYMSLVDFGSHYKLHELRKDGTAFDEPLAIIPRYLDINEQIKLLDIYFNYIVNVEQSMH